MVFSISVIDIGRQYRLYQLAQILDDIIGLIFVLEPQTRYGIANIYWNRQIFEIMFYTKQA